MNAVYSIFRPIDPLSSFSQKFLINCDICRVTIFFFLKINMVTSRSVESSLYNSCGFVSQFSEFNILIV